MKKFLSLLSIAFIVFMTSCSKGRKLMIMSSGKVNINGSTITLDPGTTHTEVTIDAGNKISVVTPSGNKDFDLKDDGLYLLNLKKDTLVGSYQHTGTDNSQKVISQDDLWKKVDSLNKLISGQNITEAGRNFNLPPLSVALITKNTSAQIIGPYRKIPGSFDPSIEHEVYKFYTTKEVMDIIDKVKKMLANQ